MIHDKQPELYKLLNVSREIASFAHENQFRSDGKPYIDHITSVADIVATNYTRLCKKHIANLSSTYLAFTIMGANLHDVIEDNSLITYDFLVQKGIPEIVINMVRYLTRLPEESYFVIKASQFPLLV